MTIKNKIKAPKTCSACKHYEPYHCLLDDSFVGEMYCDEPTICRAWRKRPDDVIHTEEYGDIEIYSQNSMEYFWQEKMPVGWEDEDDGYSP